MGTHLSAEGWGSEDSTQPTRTATSMRSIRLSMIVYFLALLGLALGGVSYLAFETSAETLRAKQESTARLLENQYQRQCDGAKAELDRHILRQAQTLVSRAKSQYVAAEQLYAAGAISTPVLSHGYLNVPLWLAEGYSPLAFHMYKMRDRDMRRPAISIDNPEEVMPDPKRGQTAEFFQTFRASGRPAQKSKSLDEHTLTMPPSMLAILAQEEELELLVEHFDDFMLASDLRLRRVTVKVSVPSMAPGGWPWPFFWPGKKKTTREDGQPAPPPPPRPPLPDTKVPAFFIQYASDTAPLEAKIEDFRADRDQKLQELAAETQASMCQLAARIWWIGLGAFAGLVAGGLFLVWLGLKPLARLSDAVSRVSPKDFQLKIDPEQLPRELQPIAGRLRETLEQLQKAFDREKQAAADISHELRTPVAALLATLDVGLRRPRTAEEYRQLLEECRATGNHMAVLVERLLALARLDAGADQLQPRAIDVADLAFQCAEMVRPLAEAKGLDLRVHATQPIPGQADPDKLREVLTNLLHNAIEYNYPKGAVDLTAERHNGQVLLAVADTGIGIAPEAQEHIFKRFFRADPSRHADTPHAGLGLAIVKSYVDLMEGSIDVASSARGTTFRILLPWR